MSVWEQHKRLASWDESHKLLISGGGQWNGNIPMPIYRNLVAMLTLGLEQTDVRVAAFAEELLDGLDRKSTRLNSSHVRTARMPSSA